MLPSKLALVFDSETTTLINPDPLERGQQKDINIAIRHSSRVTHATKDITNVFL